MKKFISLSIVVLVALFTMTGCKKGSLSITLSPYEYKVGEEFSLYTGLTVWNDNDGVISMTDDSKWTFVITDSVADNLERRSSHYVTGTKPCSGSIYAIYDAKGLNMVTNTVPIIIK